MNMRTKSNSDCDCRDCESMKWNFQHFVVFAVALAGSIALFYIAGFWK